MVVGVCFGTFADDTEFILGVSLVFAVSKQ